MSMVKIGTVKKIIPGLGVVTFTVKFQKSHETFSIEMPKKVGQKFKELEYATLTDKKYNKLLEKLDERVIDLGKYDSMDKHKVIIIDFDSNFVDSHYSGGANNRLSMANNPGPRFREEEYAQDNELRFKWGILWRMDVKLEGKKKTEPAYFLKNGNSIRSYHDIEIPWTQKRENFVRKLTNAIGECSFELSQLFTMKIDEMIKAVDNGTKLKSIKLKKLPPKPKEEERDYTSL